MKFLSLSFYFISLFFNFLKLCLHFIFSKALNYKTFIIRESYEIILFKDFIIMFIFMKEILIERMKLFMMIILRYYLDSKHFYYP